MRHPITMTLVLALLASGAGAAEPAAGPAREAGNQTLNTATATATATAAARTTAGKPAEPAKAAAGGDVTMSGMSILGNDEAPKSLVIVPWKSSQLGDTPGISRLLDDATQPVDREVFMRELSYYEIKTGSK